MLDLLVFRTSAWSAWHVFAYAFTVYLATIVVVVDGGSVTGMGPGAFFGAALLAAIAVAGIGYQEVRDSGGFRQAQARGAPYDER